MSIFRRRSRKLFGRLTPFWSHFPRFSRVPLSVVPLLDCGFPIFVEHQDSASVRFILFGFAPISYRIITFCLCCETTQRFTYCKGEYFYVTFWHDKHIIPLAHFNLANPGALTIDGQQQLQILVRSDGTLRCNKTNDPNDIHFPPRVKSYRETLAWLNLRSGPARDLHLFAALVYATDILMAFQSTAFGLEERCGRPTRADL